MVIILKFLLSYALASGKEHQLRNLVLQFKSMGSYAAVLHRTRQLLLISRGFMFSVSQFEVERELILARRLLPAPRRRTACPTAGAGEAAAAQQGCRDDYRHTGRSRYVY